jgi:hypothetical protein
MPRASLFTWKGQEYEHRPKSAEWFVAVAIVALSTSVASILFGNYLLAVVILVGAFAVALHARKAPPTHEFSVTSEGLYIGEEFHSFSDMMSFSILEDTEGVLPPLLSIKTSSWLSPHLVIPLAGVPTDRLHAHFVAHVPEEEHRPTLTDMVAGWLGF